MLVSCSPWRMILFLMPYPFDVGILFCLGNYLIVIPYPFDVGIEFSLENYLDLDAVSVRCWHLVLPGELTWSWYRIRSMLVSCSPFDG
jgi:hypothetical protein